MAQENIRYVKGEDTVLGGSTPQSEATGVFTATNASNLLNDVGHGLTAGQCITVEGSTDDLPDGLIAGTFYYVVTVLDNTFQVSLTVGGAAVTFADDGSGTLTWAKVVVGQSIDVSLYRHIVLTIAADSSPDVTIMVVGSQSDETPEFINPQSASNRYELINLIDQEDGAAIAGDTGVVIAAADVRQIVVNTDGLHWVTVKTNLHHGGDISVYSKCYSNR